MKVLATWFVAILLESYICHSGNQPANMVYPIRVPSILLSSKEVSTSSCPSQFSTDIMSRKTREIINSNYRLRPCNCGGPGWTRIGLINMSDSNQYCPSNFNLTTSPIRGCGRQSNGRFICDSIILPVTGLNYSTVCGRIYAYQYGVMNGFRYSLYINTSSTIESPYVHGLSITHGKKGARQHIWTFVGADIKVNELSSCSCSNNNSVWPHRVPSYVGQSYFCDSGNPDDYDGNTFRVYTDKLMRNGEGCPSYSSCCTFNMPPWFCKALEKPTTDDLELRLCNFRTHYGGNILINLMEIYVK